jgi:hypothetical protein
MQRNQLVKKTKVLIDGEELEGLVSFTGFKDKQGTAESPEFNRAYDLPNGVKKQDAHTGLWAPKRNGKTHDVLFNWWDKRESHDVTEITTDSTGTELRRKLYRDMEMLEYGENDYDAAGPEEWRITCILAPTSRPIPIPVQ